MNPLQRQPIVPWFSKEVEALCKAGGLAWKKKQDDEPKSQFSWYLKGFGDIKKDTFLPALLAMGRHCSFCDAYEMQSDIQATIEHFYPKSQFPQWAFQWQNLYLCCANCQVKGIEFDPELLRPDDTNYQFKRYFSINLSTGEIKPKISATIADQKRAAVTIRLYRLNSNGKPGARRSRWKHYKSSYDTARENAQLKNQPFDVSQYRQLDIEQHPYRFFIEYFLHLTK